MSNGNKAGSGVYYAGKELTIDALQYDALRPMMTITMPPLGANGKRDRTSALIDALSTAAEHGVSVYHQGVETPVPNDLDDATVAVLVQVSGQSPEAILAVHAALIARHR